VKTYTYMLLGNIKMEDQSEVNKVYKLTMVLYYLEGLVWRTAENSNVGQIGLLLRCDTIWCRAKLRLLLLLLWLLVVG